MQSAETSQRAGQPIEVVDGRLKSVFRQSDEADAADSPLHLIIPDRPRGCHGSQADTAARTGAVHKPNGARTRTVLPEDVRLAVPH